MNESEALFTSLLNCDRISLYLDKDRRLTREQSCFIASVLRRRMAGEPLEYILGSCEFMGMDFLVDRNVLIPRPETEILVETAIRYARSGFGDTGVTITDIGTGSGNIAVSLAKFLPSATIIAIDIEEKALALARRNAAAHGCAERIEFLRSDLLEGCRCEGRGDMIVSNPPYIISREIDALQPEVRHEPRTALDGGEDGFVFYERIPRQAARYLRPGGLLIMELGFGQCGYVTGIIAAGGEFTLREVVKDLNGVDRVIVAEKNTSKSTDNHQR